MNQDSSNERFSTINSRDKILKSAFTSSSTNIPDGEVIDEHPEPTPDDDEKTNRVYDYGVSKDVLMRDNEVLRIALLEIIKLNYKK